MRQRRTKVGSPARLSLALGVAVAVLWPALLQAQLPAEWREAVTRVSALLSEDVRVDGVGGVTLAVARDGHVLWTRGFGWADRGERIPAGPRTIYRTGSISKSVTAALMATMIDDGIVALDQPLSALVPEISEMRDAPEGADPTLRQVASHTAGFAREPALDSAASGPIGQWTDRILESIGETSYTSEPGSRYAYSNIGFGVLGFALERAAGTPFMEEVEDRVFRPLGMGESTFVLEGPARRHLATGYANRQDGSVDDVRPLAEHEGRGYKVPNGGVYSDVFDLARFAAGVMGRGGFDLFSDEIRMEVLSVQTPEDLTDGYGLGFSVEEAGGRTIAGHSGGVAGYTAQLLFEPETGVTIVLLRNYNAGRTNLGAVGRDLLMSLQVPVGVS